tara:strand:+ start:37 stop:405 length:369 start_codon:yes stop_codon:yes gene_type:complete
MKKCTKSLEKNKTGSEFLLIISLNIKIDLTEINFNKNTMDINDDLWIHIKSFIFPLIDYNEKYKYILHHICQPYVFSDHKNKTFDAQYNFILKQKEIVKDLNENIIKLLVRKAIKNAREIYN